MPYTPFKCTICRNPITKFSGRCDVCDNSSKQQDKRNLNNLYDSLGEKPPSKKPRRADNSGDSSALSRRSTFHAGSSNPNYSSGAPSAPQPQSRQPVPPPAPQSPQDSAQQHRTRPAEQRPVPPPQQPQSSSVPWQCPHCVKNFKKNNLQKHIKSVHENQRPFTCDSCSASFKKLEHLNRHIVTVHQKERSHHCTQCVATFGEKSNLQRHVKNFHEKKRPHHCTQCVATFGERSDLNKHLRVMHNIDPSATNQPPANQHESSGSRHPPRPPQPPSR
jgi:hypothetical protein